MKKIILTILLLAFCVSISGAGITDKLRAVIAAKGGLDKTDLIAWFDFGNAQDAHTNNYDLTEVGTPAYTTGGTPTNYGTSSDAGNMWTEDTNINDANWFNSTNQDATLIIRVRPIGDFVVNDDYVLVAKSAQTYIRGYAGPIIRGRMAGVLENHTSAFSLNTWTLVICEHIASSDTTRVTVNADTEETSGSFDQFNVGTLFVGGSSASGYNDMDIDYLAFYNRLLTADEKTWLNTNQATITYTSLD